MRDPLHGLIEFREEQFEHVLWRVMQTRPFQRLRRVKQLGFSELVYPGATHTRFSHSVGTFHVARRLVEVIEQCRGKESNPTKSWQVLAAALLHDVGHGPFSHAFETVGKAMGWTATNHEVWTSRLIQDSDIAQTLSELGSGFANDVAGIFTGERVSSMYNAVVSSQFDADRLDYMQRDRLMTGTQHGAIDFAWLIANLEVGSVRTGVDDESVGETDTFVLGSKSVSAAETYVLGLLQLYQTVYFHKATRGAEKLFTELLLRVFQTAVRDAGALTPLPATHPLIRFPRDCESVDVYLSLDDTVIWGAIPLLADVRDPVICELATRLRDRRLYRCIDIRKSVEHESKELSGARCASVFHRLEGWRDENPALAHRLLLDKTARPAYKRFDESKGLLNQIRIRSATDRGLVDIAARSAVVRAIPQIEIARVYLPRDDRQLEKLVLDIVKEELNEQPT